ncbi:hypothetical protein [Halovenus salina]|uniref:Uncharacterized protein n=1 Tax=Halovenus salina TaxID=1510225 RepID=A0ABD5W0F0_9EURY|nr:hypothetical protein [Halovenus salina]
MPGALVGVLLIVLGVLITVGGTYALAAMVGLAVLVSLYFGFQPDMIDSTLSTMRDVGLGGLLDFLGGIPFGPELVAAVVSSAVVLHLIGVGWGIAGGILPSVIGFQAGMSMFGESILTLGTMGLGFLFTLGLMAFAPIAIPAIVGATLFGVGVQFTFSVADGSTEPFAGVAEWLRSDGIPDLIYAIGSIVDSPLLIVLTLSVAIAGPAAQLLVIKLAQ